MELTLREGRQGFVAAVGAMPASYSITVERHIQSGSYGHRQALPRLEKQNLEPNQPRSSKRFEKQPSVAVTTFLPFHLRLFSLFRLPTLVAVLVAILTSKHTSGFPPSSGVENLDGRSR